nr:S1 family peptidase [Mycobacterium sp. IS-1264]
MTVAALPVLLNRIKPRRPRMHTSLLTLAIVFSSAALVAAVCLLPRTDDPGQAPPSPPLSPIALPAASAIGPGVGIYVEYADGSGGMGCTAGFLVRTGAGQTGVLTAGHCNRPGQPSKVVLNLAGILPYTTFGVFARTVSEGVRSEEHDIGLIMLDGDVVPQASAIAGSLPVSGVARELQFGQQVCKFGMSTGEAICGQVLDVTDSKVTFAAPGQCGDSGGPVYLMQSDGTATAVGIDIRGFNPAKPDAGCSAPAKFSVAELVQPWLDKWNLTAVTKGAR